LQLVTINVLVYGVNFLATAAAVFFLGCFGRKTLMVVFVLAQAVVLVGLGVFQGFVSGGDSLAIICCLLFITFFEFSSGPITWLYMAEICNDRAASAGTVANQIVNLMMSILPPLISDANKEHGIPIFFIVLGAITGLSTFYIIGYMKETKGKSPAEIEEMFQADNGIKK